MDNKQFQESIDVLSDSFQTYQEHIENKINQITKGENMENKNNDLTFQSRIDKIEKALRLQEMEIEPDADDNNPARPEPTADDLISYVRTGRMEGKSINYGADGIALQHSVLSKIFDGMCNVFPLIDKANKQETTAILNTLNIVTEDKPTAGWQEDLTKMDVDTFSVKFAVKEVKLNTCLAVIDVSKNVMEDMNDEDLRSWISNRLSADCGRVMNSALINGADGVESILTTIEESQKLNIAKADPLSGLLGMTAKLGDHLQKDAVWYMNIGAFTALLSVKGADGQPVILKHLTDANDVGAIYYLFGKPVHLLSELPDDAQIILANLKEGYTVLKHSNVTFLHQLADAYVGKVRYSCRMRIGGAVTNKKAFVLGTIG